MSDQSDRETDAPESSEPEASSKPEAAAGKVRPKTRRSAEPAAPAAKPAGVPGSRVGLFLVIALAAGGAAGWFGHVAQAKAAVARADAAPATSSSSGAPADGPCGAWEAKICTSSGKESAACQQAHGAVELLTPSTCQAALNVVPATLAKVKAARSSCESLVNKLCADLSPGSSTCAMVKERTPSFPPQRCTEMLGHYDEVIGELRQIEQQGGVPQGRPGGGPGGMPAPIPMPQSHP
jgi:hypothetical protein